MHIPDGFIDTKTVAATTALSTVGLGVALAHVKRTLPPRRVPLLGLSAAFLFAAQMLNFPVVAGTSGHLVGGVLVAALLGPSAAVVVLAAVLIVQCFLFQDGGVTALGANLFNMGILGAGGGWLIFRGVVKALPGQSRAIAAVAFAGWCSTVIASLGCAGQLAWSDRVAWGPAFAGMTGIHLFIGAGEGLISALVYAAILKTRPDLASGSEAAAGERPWREFTRFGVLVSLGLAIFVAPFASPWPDGLEKVAEHLGFDDAATAGPVPALAPDYVFPWINSAPVATALAGAIGCLVVFIAALLLGRWLTPRTPAGPPAQ